MEANNEQTSMSLLTDIASGALTGLGNIADKIIKDFKADPNTVINADLKAQEFQVELEKTRIALAGALEAEHSKQLESVNSTMREEAKSEHWPQYTWRPAIGFAVAIQCLMLGIAFSTIVFRVAFGYAIVADAVNQLSALLQAMMPLFGMEGAILGVASWFRGKKQVQTVKK